VNLLADYIRMSWKQKRSLKAQLMAEARKARPDLKLSQVRAIVDKTLMDLRMGDA
jgi:hypothetical protein